MANEEHLEILKQGVGVWNRWRVENRRVVPNLSKVDLHGTDLQWANLGSGIRFNDYIGLFPFDEVILYGVNLTRANLAGADLTRADLTQANLAGADLTQANLAGADLTGANLTGTNLAGADLYEAALTEAFLQGCQLDRADIGFSIFANVDLRGIHGLDTLTHRGPSTIGIDTLYQSGGDIPEIFLRGCGVPDSMIEYARALVAAERPIDYYSVFISYSSKDEALAKRLHADLQAAGVRCWYAPHDLPIGARIRVGIDEAIRLHDKLLLLLSKHSVASDWVEKEVETAMEQERKQQRTVLFPIRLDKAVMDVESGWPADVRRGRNIGDFSNWKQHDAYQAAFARLLRDLKAEQR